MLTATLRVIAPTWERASCPPTGEWLNCATPILWPPHNHKEEDALRYTTLQNLQRTTASKKSQSPEATSAWFHLFEGIPFLKGQVVKRGTDQPYQDLRWRWRPEGRGCGSEWTTWRGSLWWCICFVSCEYVVVILFSGCAIGKTALKGREVSIWSFTPVHDSINTSKQKRVI